MQRLISLLLVTPLLALPGCDGGEETVAPSLIDDAVLETLESGTAAVEGELVYEELEGRDNELLAMEGEVDFDRLAQTLEFSDSQAQPGESPEVSHLISDGPEYFVDSAELASGYPTGTKWVRFDVDEPAPDEGLPDTQALLEPLIAINLLGGTESVEELDSEGAQRFRVIIDFNRAAREAPAGVSNRLALFDGLTYEEGLRKGLAPIVVTVDDEGMIREVRTTIPSYSQDGKLAVHQTYTVRFDDFGRATSSKKPPVTITANWDPDLYVKGVTPPQLRSEELETSATTCENVLEVAGSLEAMASEWEVTILLRTRPT